jgi:hypothetical protein
MAFLTKNDKNDIPLVKSPPINPPVLTCRIAIVSKTKKIIWS